jgi:hypothetical protein
VNHSGLIRLIRERVEQHRALRIAESVAEVSNVTERYAATAERMRQQSANPQVETYCSSTTKHMVKPLIP